MVYGMILSFHHKGLQTFHERGSKAGIQAIHSARLRELLIALSVARGPQDLGRPSWRLQPRTGKLTGFYAVTGQANWRSVFRFVDEDVEPIDHLDDH